MGKNKTICFLGIDGSGKSTLSYYLSDELKKRDFDVSCKWWLECEKSNTRKLLRKISGSNQFNGQTKEKQINESNYLINYFFRNFYPLIVLLDYLRFGISNILFVKLLNKNKVLLFDRYYYDVIFSLRNQFKFSKFKTSFILSLFDNIIGKPDLIFIININPDTSYKRKKEEIESIEKAKKIWNNFQDLYSFVVNMPNTKIIEVNGEKEIEFVKIYILKNTLDFVEKQSK